MAININKAVDKAFESKTLKEIADAPISAIAGLTDEHGKLLEKLGIKTIRNLGEWKYANWARAIVELSKLEELSQALGGGEMSKSRVVVVQGGPSSEAEVSRASAAAVTAALVSCGHQVERAELDAALPAMLVRGDIDVVFPIVHGAMGEDGCLQGLLELLGLPYVGSGVLASALAMDKPRAKVAFRAAGLSVAPEYRLLRNAASPGEQAREVRKALGNAVVVKPARQGSAIGVALIAAEASDEDLARAITASFTFDDELLCERLVRGKEVTCGVIDAPSLGNTRALPPTEIRARTADFYDFHARYAPGASEHICPAALPPDVTQRVQAMALAAHRALGCRDLSRADFVVGDGNDEQAVTLLEVNTLPGMTGTSLYPEQMAAVGVDFRALCEALLQTALSRGRRASAPVMSLPGR